MLKVKNINISYDQKEVIKNGEIIITEGKLYIIHGKSGAGKTSLLNLLALEDNDFSYDYIFNGVNVNDLDNDQINNLKMSHISYINQNPTLIEDLTVSENIEVICTLVNKKVSSKEVNDLLKMTDLIKLKNKKVKKLSGGEKQRATIVCGIIKNAQLFLFDEPTSMLDGENKKIIVSIINYLVDQNKMVIVVTHEKELFSDYVEYRVEYTKLEKLSEDVVREEEKGNLEIIKNKEVGRVLNKLALMNFFSQSTVKTVIIILLSVCLAFFVGVMKFSMQNLKKQSDTVSQLYDRELFLINNPVRFNDSNYDDECYLEIPEDTVESIKGLKHIASADPFIYFPLARHSYNDEGKVVITREYEDWKIRMEKDSKVIKEINYNEITTNQYAIYPTYRHQNFDKRCNKINEDGEIYITKRMAEKLEISDIEGISINLNYSVPIAEGASAFTAVIDNEPKLQKARYVYNVMYNNSFKLRGIIEDATFNTYIIRYEPDFFLPIDTILKIQDNAQKEHYECIQKLMKTPQTNASLKYFHDYVLFKNDWNASAWVLSVDDISNLSKTMGEIQSINSDLSINKVNFNSGMTINTALKGKIMVSSLVFPAVMFIVFIIALSVIEYLQSKRREGMERYLKRNGFSKNNIYELWFKEKLIEMVFLFIISSLFIYVQFLYFNTNTPFKFEYNVETVLLQIISITILYMFKEMLERLIQLGLKK